MADWAIFGSVTVWHHEFVEKHWKFYNLCANINVLNLYVTLLILLTLLLILKTAPLIVRVYNSDNMMIFDFFALN